MNIGVAARLLGPLTFIRDKWLRAFTMENNFMHIILDTPHEYVNCNWHGM